LAVNKRKVLESARKYAQKGAKEKALKEYNTLLKLDPRDAKLHLEIGDAYRRWGQIEDAIAQYARVADQYTQDGFDARAVAVYKQILNLDPKRYESYVSLSDLYQRMALDSEAVSALQTAADGFHKEGRRREALELLRKMATLDPSNTTSRMKVADLLRQEGMDSEALAEYEGVAEELQRQRSTEALPVVYERILEVEPNRIDAVVALARTLMVLRAPARAEPVARRAAEAEPDSTEHLELLADIYRALDNAAELLAVDRELARLYRERGDEDRAREIVQRMPAGATFDVAPEPASSAAPSVELADVVDEPLLEDEDELLEDDDFFQSEAGEEPVLEESSHPDAGRFVETPTLAPAKPVAVRRASAAAAPPEAHDGEEVEQRLAEASVYLRYGKRDQAMASLEEILAERPDHHGALEKLGDALASGSDPAGAVDAWMKAARAAREAGDDAALTRLRPRIAELDEQAAAELAPRRVEEMTVIDSDPSEPSFEVDVDSHAPAGSGPQADLDLDLDVDVDVDVDVEIELDAEAASGDADPSAEEPDTNPGAPQRVADAAETATPSPDEVEFEIDPETFEVDLGDVGLPDLEAADAATPDGEESAIPAPASGDASAAPGNSATTSQQLRDDLEEAEFYYAQELFDEAEAGYRRILELAPNHPSALLRIGELAARRGEDPASATGADASSAANADPSVASDGDPLAASEDEVLPDSDFVELHADDDAQPAPSGLELDADGALPGLDDTPASSEAADAPADSAGADAEAAPDPLELSSGGGESGLDLALDEFGELSTGDMELDAAATQHEAEGPASPGGAGELTLPLEGPSDEARVHEPALEAALEAEGDDEPAPADDSMSEPAHDLPVGPAQREPAVTEPAAASPSLAAGCDDSFDLAAELDDAFAQRELPRINDAPNGVLSTVDEGFESIFSDFKRGVSETLSEGDSETRYDLGIAYKEMGLLEDAIGEFRVCMESPVRRVDSLHMLGLCALELGRAGDAVHHLEQLLSLPELAESRRPGIEFDLGRAYRESGDRARARDTFERVLESDPAYPGIAEALSSLASASDEAGAFESFDDLVADAEREDARESAEGFESFDDVIAEAERSAEAPSQASVEAPEAAQVEESGAPESAEHADASPEAGERPRPPRKKKISFV